MHPQSSRPQLLAWRDGRVVDYSSLENCRAERHRGFESLSLRSEKFSKEKSRLLSRDFLCLNTSQERGLVEKEHFGGLTLLVRSAFYLLHHPRFLSSFLGKTSKYLGKTSSYLVLLSKYRRNGLKSPLIFKWLRRQKK